MKVLATPAENETFTSQLADCDKFCIGNDHIIMYGTPSEQGAVGGASADSPRQDVLHVYNKQGQLERSWSAPACVHGGYNLLQTITEETQFVAVACQSSPCNVIHLYNLQTLSVEMRVAFQDANSGNFAVGAMCRGPENTILAINKMVGSSEVVVFDTSTTKFTIQDKIPLEINTPEHVHYIKTKQHGGLLIVSKQDSVIATSMDNRETIWRVPGQIHGQDFWAWGISSDTRGRLYVGDVHNDRVIVLDASTGHVIQSLTLHVMGWMQGLGWADTQPHLVIWHRDGGKPKITCFNIE